MIRKRSEHDVGTTLDRLESILKEKGVGIAARVDHAAAARKVDMELRPTQVLIFGNPRLGTPLMQDNQMAGLDLPMRVLAWEDENGETWVAYHAPGDIAGFHDVSGIPEAIEKLTGAMENLTEYAVSK